MIQDQPQPKWVLLVDPGFKSYRLQVLESLARSSQFRFVVADGLGFYNTGWAEKLSAGSFRFSYRDGPGALVNATRDYEQRNGIKFSGICTYTETSVHWVNAAQHALGLPVTFQETSKLVRNKAMVRERTLRDSGLLTPWFKVLRSRDDLVALDEKSTPFPVIAKPTEMMASLGVVKLDNFQQLNAWFESILESDFKGEDLRRHYGDMAKEVILEAYIEGQEFSAEVVVQASKARLLGVTRKSTTEGLYRDEVGHEFPASLTRKEHAQIEDFCHRLASTLGIVNSILHIEFKLTSNGPALIEMNCRLAGDLISELVSRSLDIEIGQLLAAVACGEDTTRFIRPPSKSSAVQFLFETGSGRIVESMSIPPHASSAVEIRRFADTGDLVYRDEASYGTRIGTIFGDPEHVRRAAMEAHWKLTPALSKYDLDGSPVLVFAATSASLNELKAIEREAWPESQAATEHVIESRLKAPRTTHLLAYDLAGRAIGFLCLVRVSADQFDPTLSWKTLSELAGRYMDSNKLEPAWLCGVSLSVLPSAPRGTATALLKSAASLAEKEGLHGVACGIRLPGLSKATLTLGITAEDYVRGLKDGSIRESVYHAATQAGMIPGNLLPNHYSDPDSLDFALSVTRRSRSNAGAVIQ